MSEIINAGGSNRITNDIIFNLVSNHIKKDSRLLDFGAGQGHMASRVGKYLLEKGVEPEGHLFACDINPVAFIYDKVKCLKIGTSSEIPFDEGFFDLIYAIEVLEHMPRPYDFLAEVYRRLKPGGRLVFSVPNILHMQSRMKFFLTGFGEMFGPLSAQNKNAGRICGHIMPLSYSHYHYGLRKCGFKDIRFFKDRRKKSAYALAILLGPLVRLGARSAEKSLKRYDPEVWEENRGVVDAVNSFDMLTSRSCIISAIK